MRIYYLDGIRGWAAISVLLFHLLLEIFGFFSIDYKINYLYLLIDGPLAVLIFFIISGDSLHTIFLSNNEKKITSVIIKRYFRLAGPIIVTSFIVYIIMKLNINYNYEAGYIVKKPLWLSSFLLFEPNIYEMLKFSISHVFIFGEYNNSYNPLLWPIKYEFFGSIFIFIYGLIYKNLKYPILSLIILFIYFFALGSYYALFISGMIISILRKMNFFSILEMYIKGYTAIFLLLLIFIIDYILYYFKIRNLRLLIIYSIFIVIILYSSVDCQRFMSSTFSRFLGKISYLIYCIQFPLIISYTSWLIVKFQSKIDNFEIILLIISSSVILAIVISYCLYFFEKLYLQTLDKKILVIINEKKE